MGRRRSRSMYRGGRPVSRRRVILTVHALYNLGKRVATRASSDVECTLTWGSVPASYCRWRATPGDVDEAHRSTVARRETAHALSDAVVRFSMEIRGTPARPSELHSDGIGESSVPTFEELSSFVRQAVSSAFGYVHDTGRFHMGDFEVVLKHGGGVLRETTGFNPDRIAEMRCSEPMMAEHDGAGWDSEDDLAEVTPTEGPPKEVVVMTTSRGSTFAYMKRLAGYDDIVKACAYTDLLVTGLMEGFVHGQVGAIVAVRDDTIERVPAGCEDVDVPKIARGLTRVLCLAVFVRLRRGSYRLLYLCARRNGKLGLPCLERAMSRRWGCRKIVVSPMLDDYVYDFYERHGYAPCGTSPYDSDMFKQLPLLEGDSLASPSYMPGRGPSFADIMPWNPAGLDSGGRADRGSPTPLEAM